VALFNLEVDQAWQFRHPADDGLKPAEADAHCVRKAVYRSQLLTSIQVPTRSNSAVSTNSSSGVQSTAARPVPAPDSTASLTTARMASS
jgi:hypothetical protein